MRVIAVIDDPKLAEKILRQCAMRTSEASSLPR